MKMVRAIALTATLSMPAVAHLNGNENEYSSTAKPIPVKDYAKVTTPNFEKGLIRHIVLFDLKDDVTDVEKQEIVNRFLALRKSTRDGKQYIHNIEAGSQNSSREGQGKGYDLAFMVSFLSQSDLNYYVGTPAISSAQFYDKNHQKFKEFVGPYLKVEKNPGGKDKVGVLVFDYTVGF
ncbi:Dabb family protein [Vibrio sp. YMD68]|uniref:Dabb family protein n=1 Tax=Vibrio sp. YMD68 TaxID=3042300 RepID=UPI00249CE7E4|nr:Dabb family protein [Vibrio sp. YMD68]WGV98259.1 Dabb family protein [Vibrio sp. YMD68]